MVTLVYQHGLFVCTAELDFVCNCIPAVQPIDLLFMYSPDKVLRNFVPCLKCLIPSSIHNKIMFFEFRCVDGKRAMVKFNRREWIFLGSETCHDCIGRCSADKSNYRKLWQGEWPEE